MQSPTSTSPVASAALAVPSGRARTVPVMRTTNSLRRSCGAVDDALHDAGVVAQVDEGEVLAVLAAAADPAAHRDRPGPSCSARSSPHKCGAHRLGHESNTFLMWSTTSLSRSTVVCSPAARSRTVTVPVGRLVARRR